MNREGHLGAALGVYAPVALIVLSLGARRLALLGAVATAALAMAPDVDRRLPLIRHRGITHTVWFALAVGLGLGVVAASAGTTQGPTGAVALGVLGFATGTLVTLSHLVADGMTPAGVRPWAPWGRRVSLGVARASSPVANALLLIVGGGLFVAALVLGDAVAP